MAKTLEEIEAEEAGFVPAFNGAADQSRFFPGLGRKLTPLESFCVAWARSAYGRGKPGWIRRFDEPLAEHLAACITIRGIPQETKTLWYWSPFGDRKMNARVQVVRRLFAELRRKRADRAGLTLDNLGGQGR